MRIPNSAWRITAAIASGAMMAVTVPPFDLGWVVWLCMIPLLLAIWSLDRNRKRGGFLLGWLAGAVGFGIQFSWLSEVSVLAAFILPIYLGIYPGLFGWFATSWGRPPTPPAVGAPTRDRLSVVTSSLGGSFALGAVWALTEWARGWVFTGFGWNGLGIAFHDNLVMSQAADLLGVCGLSALVVFFQAVLIRASLRLFASARAGSRAPRPPRWDFAVAALLVGCTIVYGLMRIAMYGRGPSERLRVLMVQLDIPHEGARQLWDATRIHMSYEQDTLAALEEISARDEAKISEAIELGTSATDPETHVETKIELASPDWVMWPESALNGRLLRTDDDEWTAWDQNLETIERVRSGGEFSLIYGVNELEADRIGDHLFAKDPIRAYNSLVVHDPQSQVAIFRKHHLVIFGETIPLVDSVPWLKKIYEQQAGQAYEGSFLPGASLEPLPANLHGHEISLIPSICFEDSVPRLMRRFVRREPQVIINVTNDGWFKTSPAAAQHFANARFRPIELRRPMLRCANSGVTAALDGIGSAAHPDTGESQILTDADGSHFTRGTMLAELDVPLEPGTTLYASVGDTGIISLGLIGLLGAAAADRRRHRDAAAALSIANRPPVA